MYCFRTRKRDWFLSITILCKRVPANCGGRDWPKYASTNWWLKGINHFYMFWRIHTLLDIKNVVWYIIYIYIPAFSMVFGELYKCTIHTYCAWFICIISFTLIHSHIIRTIIYVQGVKSARYKCCYYMNYFSVYTTAEQTN